MRFKDKFLSVYRSDKVYLAEWIIAVATGLFVFLTSSTWDSQSLTIWSTNVWDSIADGRFREFYAFTAENVNNVHHAHMGSEIMSVLPWSVWNLPIWIMQRFFGKPIMSSALMLAYSKLFLVVVTVVVLIYTKKIAMLITGDKTKSVWAMFLTASSTYIYLSVCYSGQNDILMIAASVLAVYCLLKNKRWAFLLWSMLAISIKPFFLLPFLAVLLLGEKNIIKIILKTALASAGLLVQKLIFRGAAGYEESMNTGPAKQMLEGMFPSNLNTNFGGISFFAITLVLIYFYCYTRDFKTADFADKNSLAAKYAVYMITVTYTCYLVFSPFSFYRLAILTPYLYIVLVQNDDMRFFNAIFDFAMQFALMMRLVLRGSKLFQTRFINKAVVQRFFGGTVKYDETSKYANIDNYLYDKNQLWEKFQPMFSGVAVVCAVLLLVLNHPEKHVNLKIKGTKNVRLLAWARMLIILPFAVFCLYLFAKTVVPS